jgi:phosphoglycolate phosphatase
MVARSMRARLVVFDLDGTLVDSVRDIASAINAALARVAPGSPALALGTIHAFVGNGAAALVARSLEALGLHLRVDEVLPVYLEEYRRRLLDTTTFYPGVLEALDALAGRTLAVLTNKPGDLSRSLLAGLGARSRFARVFGGGDVANAKPDPTGLRLLMAELRATAPETVLVGDSAVDIETAHAASVTSVGVAYGFDAQGVARAHPDAILDDLRALPGWLEERERDTVPDRG